MKKLVFSALACLAFAGSAFANNNTNGNDLANKDRKQVATTTNSYKESEDEALYCSVKTANGGEISCWICDCNELAKTVAKQDKQSSTTQENTTISKIVN